MVSSNLNWKKSNQYKINFINKLFHSSLKYLHLNNFSFRLELLRNLHFLKLLNYINIMAFIFEANFLKYCNFVCLLRSKFLLLPIKLLISPEVDKHLFKLIMFTKFMLIRNERKVTFRCEYSNILKMYIVF